MTTWQYRTDWIDSTSERHLLDYLNRYTGPEGWCVFHFEKYEMENKTVAWSRRPKPEAKP